MTLTTRNSEGFNVNALLYQKHNSSRKIHFLNFCYPKACGANIDRAIKQIKVYPGHNLYKF